MANAINFPQANTNYGKPEGWKDEQCSSLHAYTGEMLDQNTGQRYPTIMSLWQFSPEELAELNRNGGKVWLNLVSPVMVPASVFVGDPFAEQYTACVKIGNEGVLIKNMKPTHERDDYYEMGGSFEIATKQKLAVDFLEVKSWAVGSMVSDYKFPMPYLILDSKGAQVDSGDLLGCWVTKADKVYGEFTLSFDHMQSHP